MVVVEQVNAMPGLKELLVCLILGNLLVQSKGVCAALELPIFFVRPSKWKKHFDLINASKDSSRTKVIEMYPSFFVKSIVKKKDVNKTDAILIARFFNETRLKEKIRQNLIKNAKFMTHSKSNQP